MIRTFTFPLLFISISSIVFNNDPINPLSNYTLNILTRLDIKDILFIQTNISSIPPDLLTNYFPKLILNLNDDFHLSKYLKVNLYMSIIDYPEELKEIIKKIHRKFHPNTKYIIIFNGIENNLQKDLQIIFDTCLDYRIINAIVICNDLNIYTFYPYKDGGCGKNTAVEVITNNEDLFPKKIPLYFIGCEMKILVLKVLPYVIDVNSEDKPGLEVSLIREVVSRMKITPIWVKHNFTSFGVKEKGVSDENGGYTGMYRMMWLNQADIMFGMLRMNNSYVSDFEFTKIHTMDKLTWHVATASEMKKWMNIALIFELGMWVSLAVVIPLNAFVWLVLARNMDRYRDGWKCLSRTIYTLVQGSVEKPMSNPLRLAFTGWVLSSLLLSTAYQSKLISLLTKTLYEEQMATTEDFIRNGLKFGFYSSLSDLFDNPDDPIDTYIYNNYVLCPFTGLDCIDRAAYQRDFVVLKNRRQIQYLSSNYTFPDGRPRLYSFERDVFYYPLSMIMLKGNPLLARIDSLLMRMSECGYLPKFDDDLGMEDGMKYLEDTSEKPLNLEHLIGIFILYGVGMIGAVVLFVFEIGLYKFLKGINLIWVIYNKKR